jgi:hypothetical protein
MNPPVVDTDPAAAGGLFIDFDRRRIRFMPNPPRLES